MLREDGEPRQRGRKGTPARARLLEAAHDEFVERGYPPTRVLDIARRARMTHSTFYRHFTNKTDVFVALTGPVSDSVLTAALVPVDKTQAEGRAAAGEGRLRSYLEAFTAHQGFLRAWRQAGSLHPEVEELRRRFHDSLVDGIVELLERDQKLGLIAADVHPAIYAAALTHGTEAFVHDWVARGKELDEHVAEQLTGLWARSLYGSPAGVATAGPPRSGSEERARR